MNIDKLTSYLRLMRVDRPIGTLLLLWPTLWGLWLATGGIPNLRLLSQFTIGVFLMRSAGCVINDYADRHIDGLVKRTRQRPLPQGKVSPRECLWLFMGLVAIAFLLVLTLNVTTILLSGVALLLACLYPFAKRVTSLPQVVLGLAFSWSIPLAFSAVSNRLPITCWLLLLATLCWIIAYDIQYSLVDREDDLKIGVKSMAILLGRFNPAVISLLQGIMLLLIHYIGWLHQLGKAFYIALFIVAALFFYQYWLLASRKTSAYFKAFKNNNYVGLVIFLGLLFTLA